ncbi:POTRA domain-containing protein [Limnohabitans sp. Jir72]|uniref:POTRA domain-containing protein n=1 Tax=Limnohabitans sp. Jir72 TaxID=1977909 RepID=UPI000D340254|nr:POTRA domain-containing protein [Limnohabitans sp. Jir72]PUE23924.1 hypothetical protein B9Z52_17280 [Limnohabitans sp. Jir72]
MKIKLFALLGLLGVLTTSAHAQTALPLNQPGRLSDYEDPLKRSGQLRDGSMNSGTVLDKIQLDESAKPKPENQAGALKFVLNSLKVIGNSALDEKLIAEQVRSYIGSPITGPDLQDMAARITRLYAERGFLTSRCVVPAQKVDDGNVVLQIEEDRLGAVQLAGLTSYRFDPRFFIDQVNDLRGKVINVPELDERLRLVARIPGARVKPTLKKTSFGITDLVLELSDIDNLGTISFSNDGSKLTSVNRMSVAKTFNNLTGAADVLSLSGTTALNSPQFFGGFNASYQRPVGSSGGRLTFNLSNLYYKLDPKAVGNSAIRYQGDSRTLELLYEEPFRLNPDYGNIVWFAGGEHKSVNASTVYNTPFDYPAGFKYVDAGDRIFAMTSGVRLERFDDWLGYRGRSTASLSFKRALPGTLGSISPDSVSNKLDNLAASSSATMALNSAQSAATTAATLLASSNPADSASYNLALANSLKAEANLSLARSNAEKYATVTGPIGDVRGLQTNFTKFYLGLSRAQGLPYSFLLDGSLSAEWTSAKRVPQAYDFVGADNGPSGFKLNSLLSRPINDSGFVGGVGWTYLRAYSYYRDASGGGSPACSKSPGVYSATSIDKNVCSDNYPYFSLTYRSKFVFSDFTYLPKLAPYAPNNNKLRFNMGIYW